MSADRYTHTPADAAEFEARNSAEAERDGDEMDGNVTEARGCCVGGECEGHPWAQPQAARVVDGLPEATYHAGPELSVSGAKLLRKSPALYRYRQDNPEHKDAFDFGTVVHGLILGAGWPVEVVEGGRGKTERVEAARAAGKTPISPEDYAKATAIRDAVMAHPLAGRMFDEGKAEQSIYWTDERTGVPCRARVDWLHPRALIDVKSTRDASPDDFAKSCASFGYDMQAAAYSEGYKAATGIDLPFLFIAVDKEAPHLVAVYDLDFVALDRGLRLWHEALDTFAACTAADSWPGYPADIQTISLPRWAA